MVDENGAWRRQSEGFWRAHHDAWKRSDLNQRQYCEAEGIPLRPSGTGGRSLKPSHNHPSVSCSIAAEA